MVVSPGVGNAELVALGLAREVQGLGVELRSHDPAGDYCPAVVDLGSVDGVAGVVAEGGKGVWGESGEGESREGEGGGDDHVCL